MKVNFVFPYFFCEIHSIKFLFARRISPYHVLGTISIAHIGAVSMGFVRIPSWYPKFKGNC